MALKIIGTGKAVPDTVITNEEISKFVDTNDHWIASRTGVRTRYICVKETLTQLCVNAATEAIKEAGLQPEEIGLLVCSTIAGDYVTPSLSCAVAEQMGISCPSFDINAACSGFIYALDVASVYLAASKADNILIICAEMMSKHLDWTDRATCVLFGDGAGASVVTKGNALKYIHLTAHRNTAILNIKAGTGNNPFRTNCKPGFLAMQGKEVFKFAVTMAEQQARRALNSLSWSADDIDYYLLHQANKRIIDHAQMKLQQPKEKFPVNVDRYANISSASIPILLNEMRSKKKIVAGTKLLLSAFGAGLTTGTCVLVWEEA